MGGTAINTNIMNSEKEAFKTTEGLSAILNEKFEPQDTEIILLIGKVKNSFRSRGEDYE